MIRRLEVVSRAAADVLSLLHRACFPEDAWDAAGIAEITGMPGFFGRIVREDGIPTGFVLALDLGHECEVLALGVVVERRRMGMGTALLDFVCSEAQLRGADSVVLEVAVDNIAARSLYAMRGFTTIGCRRNYYRDAKRSVDALVLRLALASALRAT